MGKKKKKKGQLLAGFALETDNEVRNARKKLEKSSAWTCWSTQFPARSRVRGSTGPDNKVTLFMNTGKVLKGELKDKKEVASDIFDALSLLTKPKTR
ncbi:MAG: hypothetical protein MZU84_01385 [Sphingobacterium sp.]|nr:hypothetical protein [Sphingobacterium sp.]